MRSSRQAWATVIVGTLTMTVSYVDRQTLAVLAPHVTAALHMTDAEYGWLGSAFALAYLVATPVSGWWLDRIGARRGLVRSLLAWSSIAALHAIVPGFATLFCFRIALGLAEGPGFPGGAQTVQRMLPDAAQPRGFGVLFIGGSLGGMITPPLATWLFREFDWRVAFLGTAAAGLAWLPLWLYVTRDRDVRDRLDRHAEPDAPRVELRELIASPIMIRGVVAVVASTPIVVFVEQWGSKFLVGELHVEQGAVGHYLWLPPLWFDLGALAFGQLAAITRKGAAPPRVLYAIATVLGVTLLLTTQIDSPWGAVAVMCIAQMGSGALRTLVTADLLVRIPRHAIAFAGGLLACGQSIAQFIANPLIGYAHDHHVAYPTIAMTIAAWLIPGSLVWIAWRPADRLERKVL
jgi:MFS transporter, ACS family, hexuronate transporter